MPIRLSPEKATFFKQEIQKILPEARVFLFGSRANPSAKGGDIDILILGPRRLRLEEKIAIKVAYYKRFGEEKIDLVSFSDDDKKPFKEIALNSAIPL